MAVKLIKRGDLSLHRGSALVLGVPDTLSEDVLKALDDRYGLDENGNSLLSQWMAYVLTLEAWKPGAIMLQALGAKQDQKVIFCCIADSKAGANYQYIRQCLLKIRKKQKELEIETLAMPFIGCGNNPEVNEIALELVVAAAVGEDLHIDLYQEFDQGNKGYDA